VSDNFVQLKKSLLFSADVNGRLIAKFQENLSKKKKKEMFHAEREEKTNKQT